jgi:hypothetical protein
MPIKPENKHRYPADWKAVRQRILARARYRCEQPGCRARHGVTGYWHKSLFHPLPDALWAAGYKAGDEVACDDGVTLKVIKIVLTIAHLDHTPENCADDNLRAWCQRHHLAYDQAHHAQSAYMTRMKSRGNLDLAL